MLEYFSKLAKIAQNFVSSKLTKFEIRNWTGVECQYGEGHFIPTQLVKGPHTVEIAEIFCYSDFTFQGWNI